MAQIKHLIYPERYAGDVELATAIRELQDIQIARSDAAPDQIGPQAAPTPDPERILPSGKELWEKKLGSLSFSFPELSAKKQQITTEAVCQWVERYRGDVNVGCILQTTSCRRCPRGARVQRG